MKKKYIFCVLCIFILILEVISFLVLGKTKSRMGKIKRIPFLAYNEVTEFNSISKYNYNIATGEFSIDGIIYRVEIKEDGVLKIYKGITEVARSKKQLPTDDTSTDYKAHKGIGTNTVNHDENALFTEYIDFNNGAKFIQNNNLYKNEAVKYMKYLKNNAYEGIDITEYDENLYKAYIGETGDINFKEIIFEIANETTIELDKKIQKDAKTTNEITLEKGQYLVNCDTKFNEIVIDSASNGGFGIVIPSNVTLDLNNAVIKQIDDDTLNSDNTNYRNVYKIFRVINGENITIKNGTLIGDKAERTGTYLGEYGTGILIKSDKSSNQNFATIDGITIENMIIRYFSGDGIEINSRVNEENNNDIMKNITIKNNFIYCCNRQGISIVHVDDIIVKNNTIYNIVGTEPSDCIDIEPNVNYKGNTVYSLTGNYSSSLADNITIENNIINNYHAISTRYNTGDVTITNNTIYGMLKFYNTDGKVLFTSNIVRNGINDISNYVDYNKTMVIGGDSNSRPDNGGAGYVIEGNGNKNCPECLLIYDNDFYCTSFSIYKATFVDIAKNTFHDSFKRIKFYESDKSYKNVYIHDNIFEYCGEALKNKYNMDGLNTYDSLNIYGNEYYGLPTDQNNPYNDEYLKTKGIKVNASASDNLDKCVNKGINYIKVLKASKKQVYWIGEAEEKELFNPEGMIIGVYSIVKDDNYDATKRLNVNELTKINVSDGKEVTINNKTYKINVNKKITPKTTMIEITLVNKNNTSETYKAYQKVKTRTGIDIKNTNSIDKEDVNKKNYVILDSVLNIGSKIEDKCSVYSMFYCFDTKYENEESTKDYAGPIKVPNEFVEWSIICPNGTTKTGENAIVSASDFDEEGKITIKAKYCGLEYTQTLYNNTFISCIKETSKTSGFLGSTEKYDDITREKINSVHICKISYKLPDEIDQENDFWKVGEGLNLDKEKTYAIRAYFNNLDTGMYDIYIKPYSELDNAKVVLNRDSSYLFANIATNDACTDENVIYGLENLDTSEVVNMSNMFYNCGYKTMKSLDVSVLDTSNVEDMSYMFGYSLSESGISSYIESITFGEKFDTSKVKNMEGMFYNFGRQKLQKLDVSSFDTSNVKDMKRMFFGCGYNKITELNLGENFNTSKVTNMSEMFRGTGNQQMEYLELGDKFNTNEVKNMSKMFMNCGTKKMKILELGEAFNKIAEINEDIFYNCGANGCIINVSNKIYLNEEECKLYEESIETVIADKERNVKFYTGKIIIEIKEMDESENDGVTYLSTINQNMTEEELKSKIETNGDITIEAKGPKGEIGTGSTVKITKKGEEKDYVIVIIGDLTGDGKMDDVDLLKMARYGVGLDTNLEKAHLMAGNIVKDHSFADDKDLLKIARILVGLDSL